MEDASSLPEPEHAPLPSEDRIDQPATTDEAAPSLWRVIGAWAWAALKVMWPWLLVVGPPFLVGAAWVLGVLVAPHRAREAYFEASAQIVPVLLLALAVESRMLRLVSPHALAASLPSANPQEVVEALVQQAPANYQAFWRLTLTAALEQSQMKRFIKLLTMFGMVRRTISTTAMALLVLIALILAELESLQALAGMHDSETRDPGIVGGGVFAGLIGVGLIALLGPRLGHGERGTTV